MSSSDQSPEPAHKRDPETLILRGAPARVVRFRKGAIIGLVGFGSVALVGVTWMALKPAHIRVVASQEDRAGPAGKATVDALADVPADYADVPRLGPPLPGDLGRPILQHQETAAFASAEEGRIRAGAAEARQRTAEAERSARESPVIVRLSDAVRAGAHERPKRRSSRTAELDAAPASAGPEPTPEVNSSVAGTGTSGRDVGGHHLVLPRPGYVLSPGSVIAASLITGLNSDVPGLVTAQVTQNVYDSLTGRTLLIPQGSRLIGSYDDQVHYGQNRAFVAWSRIILPDGSSIRIDKVPAADAGGHAGLADHVDRHSWELLKGVVLSSLLGVGTELSISGENDLLRALRESTQQGGARAGDRIVTKSLDVKPTIIVRPGWPLRVVVNEDLVLPPWTG